MTTLCQQPPCRAYVPSSPQYTPLLPIMTSEPQTKVGGFLPQQHCPSPTAAFSQASDTALAPAPHAGTQAPPCPRPGPQSAPPAPPPLTRGLTLSYQQRMLSWPHMQLLEEQSSMHTQYCGEGRVRQRPTPQPHAIPSSGDSPQDARACSLPQGGGGEDTRVPSSACEEWGRLEVWALGPRSAGKRADAGGVARTEPVELRAARAWARASRHPATAWTRAPSRPAGG